MATKKKKYVPKPIRYPSLITANNSFSAFEEALERLLNTGEVKVDEHNILIYKDYGGGIKSFTATLRMYIDLIEIYHSRQGKVYDTRNLNILLNRLYEGTMFYTDEIEESRIALNDCKQIVRTIKPSELISMITTLRISTRINLVGSDESSLAWYKGTVGDIGVDMVRAKRDHYTKLFEDKPYDSMLKMFAESYKTYADLYDRLSVKEQNKTV